MTAIASPIERNVMASPEQQLTALLGSCAISPLPRIGWIRVAGEDRVRWLNGMTTNSIQQLKPDEANYNFFLSSQGRIQGDAVALVLNNSILLETAADRVSALIEFLDRFIIMDDVELAPHPSFGIVLVGPAALSILASIGIVVDMLAEMQFTALDDWRGQKIAVLHAYSPLVARFEIWSESAETIAQLRETLAAAGAILADEEALNYLRILEGTPIYGIDIRDKELAQETNQTRALHFAKGCYLGQEIVERIRSRGNVHRTFHAFELTGDLPKAGALLEVDGKAVGELTSVGIIPLASGPLHFALGYIRREALERAAISGSASILYKGGTAKPVSLPFSATERNA